jgi:hypothetical protein
MGRGCGSAARWHEAGNRCDAQNVVTIAGTAVTFSDAAAKTRDRIRAPSVWVCWLAAGGASQAPSEHRAFARFARYCHIAAYCPG